LPMSVAINLAWHLLVHACRNKDWQWEGSAQKVSAWRTVHEMVC